MAIEDNGILMGGSKAQQISHFSKFINNKYNLSLSELDNIIETDLKSWMADNYQFELGLVSAFFFELEEDLLAHKEP